MTGPDTTIRMLKDWNVNPTTMHAKNKRLLRAHQGEVEEAVAEFVLVK
jgi:hypothetical protein